VGRFVGLAVFAIPRAKARGGLAESPRSGEGHVDGTGRCTCRRFLEGKETAVRGGDEAASDGCGHRRKNIKITHADAERMALWDAMARVPREMQEHIAMKTHLIML
jgi:hypothetical protein